MWISQRTGRNTAFTAPLWMFVLGAMAVIGLVGQGSPVAIGFIALLAVCRLSPFGYRTVMARKGRAPLAKAQPSLSGEDHELPDALMYEYHRLAAMERLEQGVARPRGADRALVNLEEFARLQEKFYGRH